MAKPAETRTTAARGGAKSATTAGATGAPNSSPSKGTAAKSTPAKSTPAKSGTVKRTTKTATKAATKAATKGTASKSAAAKGTTGKTATKGSATKGSATKGSATKGSATKGSATKGSAKTGGNPVETSTRGRSAAETERIRAALQERREELRDEYDQHMAEIAELQRDRLTDSAGDDQADTGSKTFEREQEISLANSILERITQVERALERLDEGSYGWCERCGDAIPVERLAAFPSATLCVRCKQLEERR
jgi:RNA polymerase-binding protein DksA